MKRNLHTLIFAAATGVVCAALLTAVGRWTASRRAANELADKRRSILAALVPGYDAAVDAEQILADFDRLISIDPPRPDGLTVLRYGDQAAAVRFAGAGVWGAVEGYLVFAADGETLADLVVTRHDETPGLGGEIASEEFRRRWRGRTIRRPDGEAGVAIVQPPAASVGANEVEGITGATMTGERLEAMVNRTIAAWAKKEAGR